MRDLTLRLVLREVVTPAAVRSNGWRRGGRPGWDRRVCRLRALGWGVRVAVAVVVGVGMGVSVAVGVAQGSQVTVGVGEVGGSGGG